MESSSLTVQNSFLKEVESIPLLWHEQTRTLNVEILVLNLVTYFLKSGLLVLCSPYCLEKCPSYEEDGESRATNFSERWKTNLQYKKRAHCLSVRRWWCIKESQPNNSMGLKLQESSMGSPVRSGFLLLGSWELWSSAFADMVSLGWDCCRDAVLLLMDRIQGALDFCNTSEALETNS